MAAEGIPLGPVKIAPQKSAGQPFELPNCSPWHGSNLYRLDNLLDQFSPTYQGGAAAASGRGGGLPSPPSLLPPPRSSHP